MSELNKIRLNKVIREFNISLERVVEFLSTNGHDIEARPTTKISQTQYDLLLNEFSSKTNILEQHRNPTHPQSRISASDFQHYCKSALGGRPHGRGTYPEKLL